MKNSLFLVCFMGMLHLGFSQGGDYGACYSGQDGRYFELGSVLQAESYLGWSERIELEVSGGNYAAYGKHIYQIHARGGLTVEAIEVGENVSGYELRIFDNGNASNHSNKYVIGVKVNAVWASICIRARELNSNQWTTINEGSLSTIPTLTPVAFTTNWLFKSSNSAFEVESKIRSKEVVVEASPWPDYVFSENYQLRTLEEIEQYIKEFGHLPNIPTAKEVEKVGIALGEMNVLLLEKIEELTLYQIQLLKEIHILQDQNANQQELIEQLIESK